MLLILADRYHENQQHDRLEATVERAFVASRGLPDVGLAPRAACAKALVIAMLTPDDAEAARTADRLLSEAFSDLGALRGSAADEAYCRVREANVANRRGRDARSVPAARRAVDLEEERRARRRPPVRSGAVAGLAYLVAEPFGFGRGGRYRRLTTLLESQGLGDTRRMTVHLNNWSTMILESGQMLKGVDVAARAVRVARSADSEHGASLSMLNTYAVALFVTGRHAEATEVYDEALQKARAAGSRPRLISVLASAIGAACADGDVDRAVRLLGEATRELAAEIRLFAWAR